MNIKAGDKGFDDSLLKPSSPEWTKTSNEGDEDDDDDDDSDSDIVAHATGFPPPPPGKRLAPVGQEVDAEEVRDGQAHQVRNSSLIT